MGNCAQLYAAHLLSQQAGKDFPTLYGCATDGAEWHFIKFENAYEFEKRELWLEVLEDELRELHKAGFTHRDLRRPSDMVGSKFDNVFLTSTGFRLIDVGISALKYQVGEHLFERYIAQEFKEFEESRTFVLER